MKKTKAGRQVSKLAFPKAPAAIGDRSLASVRGGGTVLIVPCVKPGDYIPCVRPGDYIPCIRPGSYLPRP